jgi:hypothetical protein
MRLSRSDSSNDSARVALYTLDRIRLTMKGFSSLVAADNDMTKNL